MTDAAQSSVIEHILRDIQQRLSRIEQKQDEQSKRLTSLEHHVVGIMQTGNYIQDAVDDVRERLDRVERRQGLLEDGDVAETPDTPSPGF